MARFDVTPLQQGRFYEVTDNDRLEGLGKPRVTTLTAREATELRDALTEALPDG